MVNLHATKRLQEKRYEKIVKYETTSYVFSLFRSYNINFSSVPKQFHTNLYSIKYTSGFNYVKSIFYFFYFLLLLFYLFFKP